jgi:hypothetical protein
MPTQADVTGFSGGGAQLRSVSRAHDGLDGKEGPSVMRTITALTLLAMLPGVAQAGTVLSDQGQASVISVADSAHTLFQPSPGGSAGRIVGLPQGGFGVTTGGTSYYQTFGTPGGSGVVVPNGNFSSTVIGSGGRSGTAVTPG